VQGAQAGGGIGAIIGAAIAIGFSENRKEFEEDWAKRTDAMGRFTENLLKNLASIIRITLQKLPGTIIDTLSSIDIADLIINGVYEGIKRFFTGIGSGIKKFFSGGKNSGALTFATFGINKLFHEGGPIGSLKTLADAIPRAHSGMRITAKDLGLRTDERLIVAQEGEFVISRRGAQAAGRGALEDINRGVAPRGASGVTNHFHVGMVTTDDIDRWADARTARALKGGSITRSQINRQTGSSPILRRGI